jgi:integrase
MPRHDIDKAGVRAKLPPRREPFWGAPIERGLYVGFRKSEAGWGSWVARYHDEDRRHRYKALGPVSAENGYEHAKTAARRWMKSLAAGILDAKDVRTVADAARAYVTDRQAVKGKDCAHDAEMRNKREIYDSPLGALPLDRIRKTRIEEWRDNLVNREEPRPLSKQTANRTLAALKSILNLAMKNRYVSSERAIEWIAVAPYKNATTKRTLFLDREQRRALLNNATGKVRDLIEAVILTGARAGELVNATRAQFDHRSHSMILRGKTGERTVPLTPAASALFARLAKNKLPGAYLFTRDDGKPWAHSDWDELVRDAANKAELPHGTCLYVLRHSHISEALMAGMSTLEIAKLCGTSIRMIDRTYGHLQVTTARERLAKVELL